MIVGIICEDTEELSCLITNELRHQGGEYHETIEMIKRGTKGIIFRLWTALNPNYEWLESLLTNYPSCWVKNEWNEEGGYAGVWVGFTNDENEKIIKSLQWEDLCIEAKHYLFLEESEEEEKEKE